MRGRGSNQVAEAIDGIHKPTTVVSMNVNDFLHVYSGQATAFEVTRMIMRRRIVVEGHDFGKISSFASSFDYSSNKWEEFYQQNKDVERVGVVKFSEV